MVIEKGEVWGEPTGPPPTEVFATDASVAAYVAARPGAVISVSAGDLHRTLGLGAEMRSEPRWFPIDLGFASLDGGPERPFVAHAVVRSRGWLGPGAVVMNAAWIDDRYLGPRAHPNDGLLDVTEGSLPARQLLIAAKRAKTGTHLPHPRLKLRRVSDWQYTFPRPRGLWLDGHRVGRVTNVAVRVAPDWFTVVG